MSILFRCTECNGKIKVPDNKAGKRGKCPKCNTLVFIPIQSSEEFLDDVPKVKTSDDKTVYISGEENFIDSDVPELVDDADLAKVPVIEDEEDEIPDPRAVAKRKINQQKQLPKPQPRQSRHAELLAKREQTQAKKKGGGFFWVFFGFILAIVHTAAAILFGASLMLQRVEKGSSPIDKAFDIVKFDKRLDEIDTKFDRKIQDDDSPETPETDEKKDE